jgi:predicted phosphodiesterase
MLYKWPPFYNIPVPPRVYEQMTQMQRLAVEQAVGTNGAEKAIRESQPIVESEPLVDEFVKETQAAERAQGIEKPKGVFPVAPASAHREASIWTSTKENTFTFGLVSDTHLGSKYCREDVLNDLYDRFEMAGIERVYHAGNWIDGYIARINHHDLIDGCTTLEGQLRYMVANYPQRRGITTYAVTGDDHEGWWARDLGLDIGGYLEKRMLEAGRSDWVDLGYMEAHVRLQNANSGASATMACVHPGGGTAYAVSYHPQKYIEALEGGEKPAVVLFGHLHKLAKFNIRNVWMLMAGCTQDATPFIRLRVRQEIHLGGMIVELEQDPETGAIPVCSDKMLRYFVRSYYKNRWSKSGPVALPDRTLGGL